MKRGYGPFGWITGGTIGIAACIATSVQPDWVVWPVGLGSALAGGLVGTWMERRA